MQSIFILFVALVGIGIFARNFNNKIRLLLLLVAACMVIYVSLKN